MRYAVLAGFVLITALATWTVTGLRVNGDMTALLEDRDPAVQAYRAALASLPVLDALAVWCEPEQSEALASALRSEPGIAEVMPWPVTARHGRLIWVELTVPPSDIPRTREILSRVRVRTLAAGADCRLGGVPAFLVESSTLLNGDLIRAGGLALIGIATFFLLVYRGIGVLLLTLVPVAAGVIWGLAAGALVSGELTLLAATVPTLLAGIGIDYGIHLAQAARLRSQGGCARALSVIQGWRAVARPVSIGALTTTLAFAALMASGLRGLSDLGRTGALVTVGVYLANMLLLPILLAAYPLERLARETLLDRGLAWLARWVTYAGGWMRWGVLLMTGLAVIGVSRLELRTDARYLEPAGLEARQVQTRLSTELEIGGAPLVLNGDEDALRHLFATYRDRPEQWPAVRSVSLAPASEGAALLVYGESDPFRSEAYTALTRAVHGLARRAGVTGYRMSGSPVLNHRIEELLGRDWWRMLLIAAGSIGAALVLLMGARAGLLVLLPLVGGVVWTAGALGWLGMGVTVMSAAVFPLVFGLGIDDGVHVILYRQRHGADLGSLYRAAGSALVTTTATTVIAFGAFTGSATRGLAQFGVQAAAGLTACLAVSLLLPVFLRDRGVETPAMAGR